MAKPKAPPLYNRFYTVRSEPVMNILSYGYILAIAVFVITGITQYYIGSDLLLFALIALLFVTPVWTIAQSLITKRRLAAHERHVIAQSSPYDFKLNTSVYKQFLETEGDKKAHSYLLAESEHGRVYDLGLELTKIGSKGQRGGTETAYHTVFEGKLSREVPHIVFDSHIAHGKQFRSYYLGAQRLNLDIDMADYYDAYAPYDYEIDTLSIIGPEVLDVMKRFRLPCDVEFTGTSLVCYAPLLRYDDVAQYQQQCEDLLQKFNDTLTKYRDDHALGMDRRVAVHGFARTLLRNPLYRWPALVLSMIIFVGSIVGIVVLGTTHVEGATQIAVNVMIFMGVSLVEPYRAFALWRSNKRQKQSFELSQQYVNEQNAEAQNQPVSRR